MNFDIFNRFIAKLFSNAFPKSDMPFLFEDALKTINLEELVESKEDKFFFDFYNTVPVFKTYIRGWLVWKGYLRLTDNPINDVQLTSKGIEAVEFGGIEQYQDFIQEQKELQRQLLKSTIDTNQSVQDTNTSTLKNYTNTRKISIASILVAFASVIISSISLFRKNDEASKQIQPILKQHTQILDSLTQDLKEFRLLHQRSVPDTLKDLNKRR